MVNERENPVFDKIRMRTKHLIIFSLVSRTSFFQEKDQEKDLGMTLLQNHYLLRQ